MLPISALLHTTIVRDTLKRMINYNYMIRAVALFYIVNEYKKIFKRIYIKNNKYYFKAHNGEKV